MLRPVVLLALVALGHAQMEPAAKAAMRAATVHGSLKHNYTGAPQVYHTAAPPRHAPRATRQIAESHTAEPKHANRTGGGTPRAIPHPPGWKLSPNAREAQARLRAVSAKSSANGEGRAKRD